MSCRVPAQSPPVTLSHRYNQWLHRRPYFNFPLSKWKVFIIIYGHVFGRMDGIRSTWACVFHVDVNLSFESSAPLLSTWWPGWLCICRVYLWLPYIMDMDNPRNALQSHLCVLWYLMASQATKVTYEYLCYTSPVMRMMMILGTCVTIISI